MRETSLAETTPSTESGSCPGAVTGVSNHPKTPQTGSLCFFVEMVID
jgi:hypothetical protein